MGKKRVSLCGLIILLLALPLSYAEIAGNLAFHFEDERKNLIHEEVTNVIAQNLGFPSKNIQRVHESKTNLLVIVDGSEHLQLSQSTKIEGSFDETSSQIASHIFSINQNGDSANIADVFCQVHENPLYFLIATNSHLLHSFLVHEFLMSHSNPTLFQAHYDLLTSKLNVQGKYDSESKDILESLFKFMKVDDLNPLDSNGKPLFDLTNPTDNSFLTELTLLSKLMESIEQTPLRSLLNDEVPDLIVFVSSSFKELESKYGVSSVQYKTASSLFDKVVSKVKSNLRDGSMNLLTLCGNSMPQITQQRRSPIRRDHTDINGKCFGTQQLCQNSTNSCSGKGNCTLIKSSKTENCFRCKCNSTYTGESCEFIDIVAPFHIIFWLSLAIILALILICSFICYTDAGTDTLLFRTPVRPKRD